MLTPLDIENQKFSKQMMNGYSIGEVDDFLDEVTSCYEKVYKENSELKAKLTELEGSMSKYKTLEDTLQNTLVVAQTTAEEVKTVAKEKAEQIINEAKASAMRESEEIQQKMTMKIYEYDELRKQFGVFKAKMESLLISQLELLKGEDD